MSTRIGWFVTAAWVLAMPAFAGQAPKPPANEDCLACHGDATATRDDGRSIAVDPARFGASKHAALACVDCHADLATVTEFPHASRLKRVQCGTCHDGPQAAYASSVHGVGRRNGQTLAATCADCHGTHDILGADDPASRTNHQNLPRTCGTCHGNLDVIKRANIQIGDVVTKYHDSIHGKALEKSGLVVAPSCVDCHGSHDIKRHTDPASRVAQAEIPVTCGRCHTGIKQKYDLGIHAAALKRGDPRAPSCADCHTAHAIQRADTDQWRLAVTAECGTCHAESMTTFRDTFHGQVTSLGFARVATCADCHGAHDILPASNPASTISSARLVQTCGRCHPGANAGFVQYDPHADRRDRARNPVLYYASKFMNALLLGVFLFFGVHTALWLPRGLKHRREGQR